MEVEFNLDMDLAPTRVAMFKNVSESTRQREMLRLVWYYRPATASWAPSASWESWAIFRASEY